MVHEGFAEQLTELEYAKCRDINLNLYIQAQICTQSVAPTALVSHCGAVNYRLFIIAEI